MNVNNQNTNSHNRLVAGSIPAGPTFEANPATGDTNALQKVACSPSDLLQLRDLLNQRLRQTTIP
jgi:hypothetical protein